MLFQCSKDFPLAQTKQGTLRGYVLDGVYTFHGIKYADAQRWQMPQPAKSWEGIKNADSFGFVCPIMYDDAPGGELRYHHGYWPSDENCQYLNVWSNDMTAKKPVMVWIHGGGYSFGSCKELAAVDGDSLCRRAQALPELLHFSLSAGQVGSHNPPARHCHRVRRRHAVLLAWRSDGGILQYAPDQW